MYLYGFDKFAGSDKIFMIDENICPYKAGDIIADGESIFLVVGKDICFAEQYRTVYKPYHTFTVVEKKFFSPLQLSILHHVVQTYYSTYKAVMRLFLPPMDIASLLTYKKSSKKSVYIDIVFDEKQSLFVPTNTQKEGQQLILVPDLRTAHNLLHDDILSDATLRHSWLSALQMTKIFRWCKQGQVATLITTFGGIFHDRKNLKRIVFIQPHKRYYQHQQDPRYKVAEVMDFIANNTGAELVKWE